MAKSPERGTGSVERAGLAPAPLHDKEVLEAVFNHIPVMISFYGPSRDLLHVNREWERTLGWSLPEARAIDILAAVYPDAERRREVVEFMDRAEHRWRDFEARTRDGRTLTISWMRFALSDGSRIGFGMDVTDRRRAEAERERLLESETAARAEAEAALERLRAIESITDSALRHLGLDDLLRELLARLQRILDTDTATVFLLDEGGQTLSPRAAHGYELVPSVRVRVGSGVTGLVAARGQPLIVDDYSTVDVSGIEGITESELRATVRSVMGVPFRIGDTVVGVVVASSGQARHFNPEQLRLMGLVADRVAPAIELGRLVERVRDGRERQKVLARRLLTAQEEERRRLAVELHDELGQVLTAVKINLASLERLSAGSPPSAHLREALESVDDAMVRARDLALALRPSVLDDLGLPAALRWYADRFSRDARVEAHLSIDAVPRLEPELETACFRVAQEALTNVARHAQARQVWLDLHLQVGWLELVVRDDGIGFDAPSARERAISGASMGLLGMQERVMLVGGECAVSRRPEGGTEVRVRLPVGEPARGKA